MIVSALQLRDFATSDCLADERMQGWSSDRMTRFCMGFC